MPFRLPTSTCINIFGLEQFLNHVSMDKKYIKFFNVNSGSIFLSILLMLETKFRIVYFFLLLIDLESVGSKLLTLAEVMTDFTNFQSRGRHAMKSRPIVPTFIVVCFCCRCVIVWITWLAVRWPKSTLCWTHFVGF